MIDLKFYVAKAKKEYDRKKSASGAMWQVLSTQCLKDGWVVYGAVFSDKFLVHHIRCTSFEELQATYGSKYVQSDLGNIIRQICIDLKEDKKVLFSGTPCQVAAVRKCTNGSENLVLCDIICHGVLSNKMFLSYIAWLEKKKRGKICSFTFRDKSKGMSKQRWKATLASGEEITDSDVYTYNRIYYSDKMLRESCYYCKFASLERVGDITLGDVYQYSDKLSLISSDDLGISSVIINTELGEHLFEKCSQGLEWIECGFDDIKQPQLISPTKKKDGTGEWITFEREGFSGLVNYHFNISAKDRIIHSLKDLKRRIL